MYDRTIYRKDLPVQSVSSTARRFLLDETDCSGTFLRYIYIYIYIIYIYIYIYTKNCITFI